MRLYVWLLVVIVGITIVAGCGGGKQAPPPSTEGSTTKVAQLPTEGAPVPGTSREQTRVQPTNRLIDRPITEHFPGISSEEIYGRFGDPTENNTAFKQWTYLAGNGQVREKLMFTFVGKGSDLRVNAMDWYPMYLEPIQAVLPATLIERGPQNAWVLVDATTNKEQGLFCLLFREANPRSTSGKIEISVICRSGDYCSKTLDPSTNRDHWRINGWRKALVTRYFQGPTERESGWLRADANISLTSKIWLSAEAESP